MKLTRVIIASITLLVSGSFVFAQQQSVKKGSNSNKETETSVENEYLNDVDGDIIMSLANSDELDNKLVALQYLQNAIEDGNTSDTVIQALDQLAGEGLTTQSRTKGRVINNFPEIRRQACLLLAKVPTEHSKNTLVSIALADNEPMVIAAAVHIPRVHTLDYERSGKAPRIRRSVCAADNHRHNRVTRVYVLH